MPYKSIDTANFLDLTDNKKEIPEELQQNMAIPIFDRQGITYVSRLHANDPEWDDKIYMDVTVPPKQITPIEDIDIRPLIHEPYRKSANSQGAKSSNNACQDLHEHMQSCPVCTKAYNNTSCWNYIYICLAVIVILTTLLIIVILKLKN